MLTLAALMAFTSLPALTSLAFSHSNDSEFWRVLTTTTDVGNTTQPPPPLQSPLPVELPASGGGACWGQWVGWPWLGP